MIRVVIVLYPGLFREGMLAIIDGMKDDRQHEQEIIFVDKITSHMRKNRYSVIRASIQSIVRSRDLPTQEKNLSCMENMKRDVTPSSCPTSWFSTENSNAGPKWS